MEEKKNGNKVIQFLRENKGSGWTWYAREGGNGDGVRKSKDFNSHHQFDQNMWLEIKRLNY